MEYSEQFKQFLGNVETMKDKKEVEIQCKEKQKIVKQLMQIRQKWRQIFNTCQRVYGDKMTQYHEIDNIHEEMQLTASKMVELRERIEVVPTVRWKDGTVSEWIWDQYGKWDNLLQRIIDKYEQVKNEKNQIAFGPHGELIKHSMIMLHSKFGMRDDTIVEILSVTQRCNKIASIYLKEVVMHKLRKCNEFKVNNQNVYVLDQQDFELLIKKNMDDSDIQVDWFSSNNCWYKLQRNKIKQLRLFQGITETVFLTKEQLKELLLVREQKWDDEENSDFEVVVVRENLLHIYYDNKRAYIEGRAKHELKKLIDLKGDWIVGYS